MPAGAAAVFVNFQINNATTTAGYINPYATSATSRPGVSLNFDASPATSIGAIVPLAADGTIKMYLSAGNTIDLLLDVEGYFTAGGSSSSAGVFTPAVAKIYDTRSTTHVAPGATVTIPIGGTNDIPTVANGLSAITANLTVVDTGTAGGYARAYASGTTEPTNVSTLTFSPATAGKYTTNLATIPVGTDNAIKIHNVSTDTGDYILDLNGWYTKMPTVEVTCPQPFVSESWTEGTTPTMVNCKLAATNPYGTPLSVDVTYDDTSYGPYTVPAKSSISPALAIPAQGGGHSISAETETPDGEPVVTSYEFTVGDWTTAQWDTSVADSSTTDLRPTLDYAPNYGTFQDSGSLVFTLSTKLDGRTNPIQTSNGTTREMPVTAGLLAPGTTYYWTATATGSVEGRQGLKTRTSKVYRFTTSAKYTSADEPTTKIQFSSFESAGYVETFASILDDNGAQTTASFFAQAAKNPAQIELPGLVGQTDATKKQVFAISADAAASDLPLTESDLPVEVQSPTTDDQEISTFSVSSAVILGSAIHNKRTWQAKDKLTYKDCNWFYCTPKSWIEFTATIDPGKRKSRTGWKFTKWGNKIGSMTFNSTILSAGYNASESGWMTWNTPGTGTQYNNHASTLNKSFQAYYRYKIATVRGDMTGEFKTKKSSACKEPPIGAYQCLF